ncbi:hypothetical protein ES708_12568 [subsurface metagenome]
MSIRKIDGVTIDADTLDSTDLATLTTEADLDAAIAVLKLQATLYDFRAIPATGTFDTKPEAINDIDLVGWAKGDTQGQYAEVDLGRRLQ